ncbi:hypothetical protein E6W39_01760 [Kitasatospora acidiphila]|uniref:Uncharacterized protein n=1 Tax=Kitasatospora acidiphila TaxID=2567942 RepID=A0A540VYK2_9ACTN|nr:hypothetical protein [Kitasatospora acidiphila]TQF01194.1 hypothetical protein E6W39_01760 [Kitasatospora acidiphila]
MTMIMANRRPADRRLASLAELRSLGQQLDRQVADRGGAGDREVDAMLTLMRQAHLEVVRSLREAAVDPGSG